MYVKAPLKTIVRLNIGCGSEGNRSAPSAFFIFLLFLPASKQNVSSRREGEETESRRRRDEKAPLSHWFDQEVDPNHRLPEPKWALSKCAFV